MNHDSVNVPIRTSRPGDAGAMHSLAALPFACIGCAQPCSPVFLSLGAVRLHRCTTCGTVTQFPRPSAADQAGLHDTAEYFEHPYFELRRNASHLTDRRCRRVFAGLSGAGALSFSGRRLLDVGCDTGAFLESAARLFGVVPVGIDVAARAVASASGRGIECYRADIEHLTEDIGKFDIITALDVIEHVADPLAFLFGIQRLLVPGGIAYIETPNISSMVYRIGRTLLTLSRSAPSSFRERLFPPQHIQYFTQGGVRALASQSGLEAVQVSTRILPFSDIASSLVIRLGLAGLQTIDQVTREMILICAALRKRD